jgi:hypothetical protein
MLHQIKVFKGNALAVELPDTFTEADVQLLKQLFEEKLNQGHKHVNLLCKVKDLSMLKHIDIKTFFKSEMWGIKHFSKIGRCAVVAHSDTIKSIINLENKVLRLINPALEEKYFDTEELDAALKFISPDEEGEAV